MVVLRIRSSQRPFPPRKKETPDGLKKKRLKADRQSQFFLSWLEEIAAICVSKICFNVKKSAEKCVTFCRSLLSWSLFGSLRLQETQEALPAADCYAFSSAPPCWEGCKQVLIHVHHGYPGLWTHELLYRQRFWHDQVESHQEKSPASADFNIVLKKKANL